MADGDIRSSANLLKLFSPRSLLMTMKAETDLLESITTMRNVVAKLVSPEAASIAQSGPELQQLLVGKRLLINHFQTPAEYQMHCGEARKSEDHGYEQQNVNCHLSAFKLRSHKLTDIRARHRFPLRNVGRVFIASFEIVHRLLNGIRS